MWFYRAQISCPTELSFSTTLMYFNLKIVKFCEDTLLKVWRRLASQHPLFRSSAILGTISWSKAFNNILTKDLSYPFMKKFLLSLLPSTYYDLLNSILFLCKSLPSRISLNAVAFFALGWLRGHKSYNLKISFHGVKRAKNYFKEVNQQQ